jgi:serine/threonine protein kinase
LTQLASTYENKKVPLEIIQVYSAQIILFLNFIHTNGIVHRDLKPENILIGKDLSIKVIDYGDSKFLDPLKNE